jgi:hypothetical protein
MKSEYRRALSGNIDACSPPVITGTDPRVSSRKRATNVSFCAEVVVRPFIIT